MRVLRGVYADDSTLVNEPESPLRASFTIGGSGCVFGRIGTADPLCAILISARVRAKFEHASRPFLAVDSRDGTRSLLQLPRSEIEEPLDGLSRSQTGQLIYIEAPTGHLNLPICFQATSRLDVLASNDISKDIMQFKGEVGSLRITPAVPRELPVDQILHFGVTRPLTPLTLNSRKIAEMVA